MFTIPYIEIWIAFGIFFFMGMLTGAKHHKWYDDLIDDDSDENFLKRVLTDRLPYGSIQSYQKER